MKSAPKESGMLSTAAEIRDLAQLLSSESVISFDTEFIRESTFYPITEIIQIGTRDNVWLVDARAFKKNHRHGPKGGYDAGLEPLLDIFRDKKILKILHAAQGDQECLYTSFGMLATPTLDTAVAASLLGYGDNIGLGKLLKTVLDVNIQKGHARTNWSVRPLPEALLGYARADVEHLVLLGETLLAKLAEMGRKEWALELTAKMEDPAVYETDINDYATRLARGGRLDRKGYAALMALVKWREERVRALNLPRRWVADDSVLVDIAQVRPKDVEHLGAFRGLNKGEIKASGEAILSALRASEGQDLQYPQGKGERQAPPTSEEGQVLELLKCYVGILAEKHRVAAKHLSTTAQLLPLLRSKVETQDDLVKYHVLTAESARLVGDELLAFLRGRRALMVEGKQIHIREIN